MKRLGVLVGEDNWSFFGDIYTDLTACYQTQVFRKKTYRVPLLRGRLNRWVYHQSLTSIMRSSEVCFFEWASELLMHASQLPKRCRIVTRLHSFELYAWAPRIDWSAVDKVILVSRAMQRSFNDLYPDHANKTLVINNGVSLKLFKPPERRSFNLTLGMLCHLVSVKRVYEVVLMLSNLRQQGCNATLRIAGNPDEGEFRYAAAVYRLVKELKLGDSVIFDGFVSGTSAWLRNIDIFISNSYWEGQQVALLEAMASGCYCLAHFWPGAEEVLPTENLYIHEAELRQRITEYADLPDEEKQVRQNQLRCIAEARFDIEQTKAKVREAVRQASRNWLQTPKGVLSARVQ